MNPSIAVVLLAVVINMSGVGLIWPILPAMVERLNGGSIAQVATAYGAVAVVYSIAQFLFAPVMGALSDRFGRRRVMLVALLALGIDSIVTALAPNLFWMFVARFIGGALASTFSIAQAYVADVTDENDRAAGFGMIGAAFGIGFIIGPLIGGVLGEIDLRLPFFFAAALSFANFLLGLAFLRETLPPERRKPAPWHAIVPLAALWFVLRDRGLLLLGLALLSANTVQRGLESIWVLFTDVQYGWGTREAGLSLAVVGLSFFVVQGFLVRRVVAAIGEIAAVTAGFCLSAAVYLVLAFNTAGWVGFVGILPHVLGWGVAGPALQAIASRRVDASRQGQLQGSLTAIAGLAAILGPATATTAFAFFTSALAPVHFPGAYFLVGVVFLLLAAALPRFAQAGPGATPKGD